MKLLEKGQAFEDRFKGGIIWTLVLTSATGTSAVFMFLVHVVAVRMLKTEQYGEFASAIALVGIVGVAASSVQAATVKKVKEPQIDIHRQFSRSMELLFLTLLSLALGVTAFLFVGVSFNTASLLALWVPAAVMIARANGEIQGREIQTILHGATAVIAAATLILSAILLLIWNDVESLLIARLGITIFFATYLLKATGTPINTSFRLINFRLIHSTILVSSMWFAANMDVLLSRSALGKTENGEIAVAAMLVNSVLLIPGLIAAVVYPRAIELRRDKKSEIKLLTRAILLSGFVQLLLAVILSVMAEFLVRWLAGEGHETAINLIFPLSMAYVPIGIAIVVTQFVLALGKLWQSIIFLVATSISSLVLIAINGDAETFVHGLLVVSWLLVFILIALTINQIARIKVEE